MVGDGVSLILGQTAAARRSLFLSFADEPGAGETAIKSFSAHATVGSPVGSAADERTGPAEGYTHGAARTRSTSTAALPNLRYRLSFFLIFGASPLFSWCARRLYGWLVQESHRVGQKKTDDSFSFQHDDDDDDDGGGGGGDGGGGGGDDDVLAGPESAFDGAGGSSGGGVCSTTTGDTHGTRSGAFLAARRSLSAAVGPRARHLSAADATTRRRLPLLCSAPDSDFDLVSSVYRDECKFLFMILSTIRL